MMGMRIKKSAKIVPQQIVFLALPSSVKNNSKTHGASPGVIIVGKYLVSLYIGDLYQGIRFVRMVDQKNIVEMEQSKHLLVENRRNLSAKNKDLIKNNEKMDQNIEFIQHCSMYLGIVVVLQLIH